MNEGKIAIVTTEKCSRFFKGDKIKLIRHIKTNNKYYAQRVEGFICGEIGEEDFEIESNSKR